jgi:hypothetical protein
MEEFGPRESAELRPEGFRERVQQRLVGQEPPVSLREAVRLALGDIDAGQHVAWVWFNAMSDDLDADEATGWNIHYSGATGGIGGFGAAIADGRECEMFVAIADQLQDHLGDDLDSSTYRPPCAIHDHPAVPACVDGQARWCCRRGYDAWSAPIGSLGLPPRLVPVCDEREPRFRLRVVWD